MGLFWVKYGYNLVKSVGAMYFNNNFNKEIYIGLSLTIPRHCLGQGP